MSFQTHEKQGLLWLTSESLALSGVVHGFSTRRGGVSAPPWDSLNLGLARGDEDACVRENYRRFCAAIGADVEKTVLSRQVVFLLKCFGLMEPYKQENGTCTQNSTSKNTKNINFFINC